MSLSNHPPPTIDTGRTGNHANIFRVSMEGALSTDIELVSGTNYFGTNDSLGSITVERTSLPSIEYQELSSSWRRTKPQVE